jgi:hypothetical protein
MDRNQLEGVLGNELNLPLRTRNKKNLVAKILKAQRK